MSTALFLRLLPHDDKAAALAEAVAAVREGRTLNPVVHTVDPTSFRRVPGSPFAYWASERIRQLFTELPPFEGKERTVKQGLATADDFRFVRAWWEVSPERTLTGTAKTKPEEFREQTFAGKQWVPFAKGGEYSPYYSDLHLVVNWERNGEEIRNFDQAFIRNENFYFRPGLTWPLRTQLGFNMRACPAGSAFGHKGPVAFVPKSELPFYLGLSNSDALSLLISLQMAFGSYEVGVIQRTPVPNLSGPQGIRLSKLALSCVNLKRDLNRSNETSHIFHLPALLQVSHGTLGERLASWQARVADTERQLAEYQREINDIAFRLYGIEGEDRRTIEEVVSGQLSRVSAEGDDADGAEEETEVEATADARGLVADLLSYAFGCSFGRWDVHFATGEKQTPELPDPFAPLPICSPGMLTDDDGLALQKVPLNYPISIDRDGILVDDPEHQDGIVRRVRGALEVIWKEHAEAIEQEACEILDIKELRDYFRKSNSGGFWMDHVRHYSKSRRKAPIYWLLQSYKKNYALWIYYHRLDKDLLFKALLNYVEPKIRLEESRLGSLRSQKQATGDSGKAAKNLDKEIEKQEDFLSELRDFEDKLRRVANLHLEPDLNDGVVLNIAPLHELVPWKEAKNYWEELLAGKYEWSSIGKQLREKGLIR